MTAERLDDDRVGQRLAQVLEVDHHSYDYRHSQQRRQPLPLPLLLLRVPLRGYHSAC